MESPNFNIDEKNVEEAIVQEIYIQSGLKTTICLLMLNTGSEAVGSFSPINMQVEVIEAKKEARKDAFANAFKALSGIAQWRSAIFENNRKKEEEKAGTSGAPE